MCLFNQGKYADAERIGREVHGVQKRVLGAEHPNTLTSAANLAASLSGQGKYKYTDAERMLREVHEVVKRVHGAEHPRTLMSANNLAESLAKQGKYADAERIQREVHGVQKRVLGAEHPDTLATANNLAASLSGQGKYTEAERILHAALASLQRVLGPAHPNTLAASAPRRQLTQPPRPLLARRIRCPTALACSCSGPSPSPSTTASARVVSFDARTGRYAVSLDDGKELSLKAECVARAGCAAAGCASEEASSMCGQCKAVWYCSRECQRTDWKAHKPVCTAQTNVSADCVVQAVVQETSLTSSNTENVDTQSNTCPCMIQSPEAPMHHLKTILK
jgi:hypothetical protein